MNKSEMIRVKVGEQHAANDVSASVTIVDAKGDEHEKWNHPSWSLLSSYILPTTSSMWSYGVVFALSDTALFISLLPYDWLPPHLPPPPPP